MNSTLPVVGFKSWVYRHSVMANAAVVSVFMFQLAVTKYK